MITFSSNFTKQAELNNPNKMLLIQLYYDDNSSFFGFAGQTKTVSDVQYIGAVTSFSAPKTKWNWSSQNNITVTSPTLTIANIQMPNYSFIDDEFTSKNFFGRTVKIYVGYPELTTLSDFALIYNGKIDDLVYAKGALSVKFKTTDVPDIELTGKKFDPKGGEVGQYVISGMVDGAKGKCAPLIFGEHWCAPLTYYQNEREDTNHYYAIQDTDNTFFSYQTTANVLPTTVKNNTVKDEPRVCSYDTDYLVPIPQTSFGVLATSTWNNIYDVSSDSGLGITKLTVNTDEPDVNDDGTVQLFTPMRFDEDIIADGFVERNVTYGPSLNLWDAAQDGNNSTFFHCRFTGWGTAGSSALPYWPYFGFGTPTAPIQFGLKWNLRGVEEYSNAYGNHPLIYERPIHLPNNTGSSRESNIYMSMTGDGHSSTGMRLSMEVYKKRADDSFESQGYYWYDNPEIMYDNDNDGDSEPGQDGYHQFSVEGDVENRLMSYGGLDDNTWTFNPNGYAPVTDWGWPEDEDGEISDDPNFDPVFNARETWETGYMRALWYLGGNYGTTRYVRLYDFAIVHNGIAQIKNDLFAEADGVMVDVADMYSMSGSGDVQLSRPYEYLEAIFRGYADATDSDFSDKWAGMSTIWETLYNEEDRDGSGFVINRPTKLSTFLKEYLKGEVWSVYRDELAQYNLAYFKPTYDSDDVDLTVQFDDCDKFDIGLTPLKDVTTDIKSVKIDYQYFNNKYATDSAFNITSSGYNYTYYDLENSEEKGRFSQDGFAKKYTSHSTERRISYSSTMFRSLRRHLSGDDYDLAGTGADFPWSEWRQYTGTATGDPAWVKGKEYAPWSQEAYVLARRYLNLKGNRHREIKLTTANMEYFGLQIGDVINFRGVPNSLLGMQIAGFGSDAYSETATLNGQTVYEYFIITETAKNLDKIDITAVQLHSLDSLDVDWGQANG